jgi:hypothetical protein
VVTASSDKTARVLLARTLSCSSARTMDCSGRRDDARQNGRSWSQGRQIRNAAIAAQR